MSIKNLQDRIEKLERRSGGGKPDVFIVVHFIDSNGEGKREILTAEEEGGFSKI